MTPRIWLYKEYRKPRRLGGMGFTREQAKIACSFWTGSWREQIQLVYQDCMNNAICPACGADQCVAFAKFPWEKP